MPDGCAHSLPLVSICEDIIIYNSSCGAWRAVQCISFQVQCCWCWTVATGNWQWKPKAERNAWLRSGFALIPKRIANKYQKTGETQTRCICATRITTHRLHAQMRICVICVISEIIDAHILYFLPYSLLQLSAMLLRCRDMPREYGGGMRMLLHLNAQTMPETNWTLI